MMRQVITWLSTLIHKTFFVIGLTHPPHVH
jgi:hypothetical protein